MESILFNSAIHRRLHDS